MTISIVNYFVIFGGITGLVFKEIVVQCCWGRGTQKFELVNLVNKMNFCTVAIYLINSVEKFNSFEGGGGVLLSRIANNR